MSVLIRNGRIVGAEGEFAGDLYIEGETIRALGRSLPFSAERTIDATGRLVLPGAVDPHTHLDLPAGECTSSDDFETGTRAAALGGTTTILDFPTQTRGRSMLEALDAWHGRARAKACIDYGFHMIVTDLPVSRLGEMRRLVREEGVTSFKLFMAYPGVLYLDDGVVLRAMRQAASDGAMVLMHAENGLAIDELRRRALAEGKTAPVWHARTRPPLLEAEAVARATALAEVAGVRLYVVHVSCADALFALRDARQRALAVYGETCPQYLFLDETLYERPDFEGARWVMTPPLRCASNFEPLWRALASGELDTVATDHCPFLLRDKERGRGDFTRIPNGAPGIQNRLSLLYFGAVVQGHMSLSRFVEVTSTNAARLFGLYPHKGALLPGSDADIVIFDPEREETISVSNPRTHAMRVDYNAYEGIRVKGFPETVLQRGEVIVEQGRFVGRPGAGRFLKRRV